MFERCSLALALAAAAVALVASSGPSASSLPDLSAVLSGAPLDLRRDFAFHPVAASGVRGPCPFLNTAANHGLLPRSGRAIPLEHLANVLSVAGLPSAANKLLISGLRKGIAEKMASDHPADQFDLSDLNPHGVFEHDLSLTRRDAISPALERQRPDPTLVDGLLDLARRHSDHFGRAEPHLYYADLAQWRRRRYEQETAAHAVRFNARDQFLAHGECGLLLELLGRNGEISISHARSILLEERFPADWQPTRENGFTLFFKLQAGAAKCGLGYYTPDGLLKSIVGNEAGSEEADGAVESTAATSTSPAKLFTY
jgi:hypothetical protein